MTAPTSRAEVCRYAAGRLRNLLSDASQVPWSTTGPSNRYGGIVAPATPSTRADEVEGYGGELVAESVLAGNGNLILTLSAAVVPVLAILDEAGVVGFVTDAELALARGILDAGEVGWTRNRRPTREETEAAVADIVDAEAVAEYDPLLLGDDEVPDGAEVVEVCARCEHPTHARPCDVQTTGVLVCGCTP